MIDPWHWWDVINNLLLCQILLPAALDSKLVNFQAYLTFHCTCTHNYSHHLDMCGEVLCCECKTGGRYSMFTVRGGIKGKCKGIA